MLQKCWVQDLGLLASLKLWCTGWSGVLLSWPVLTFFSDLCCIGFSMGSDQMGWPLFPASRGESWMPWLVLFV